MNTTQRRKAVERVFAFADPKSLRNALAWVRAKRPLYFGEPRVKDELTNDSGDP